MRNISDKRYRENQNTHFMFNNLFLETRAVYEKMWKSMVESDRPQITIQYGACFACWITKATDTHIQNMQYLLLFHGNNDYTKALQCYVIRKLPILLYWLWEPTSPLPSDYRVIFFLGMKLLISLSLVSSLIRMHVVLTLFSLTISRGSFY
jgi:hypothetical protein